MAKYSAGGIGTVLVGAAMVGAGAMSKMPSVNQLTGGLPAGSLMAGGAVLGAAGLAYMLASQ